jgi:hypothetical protein
MATEREFVRLRGLMAEIEPLLEDDTDENFEKLSKLWEKVFEITMDENGHHRDGFRGRFDRWLKKHGSL